MIRSAIVLACVWFVSCTIPIWDDTDEWMSSGASASDSALGQSFRRLLAEGEEGSEQRTLVIEQ